MTDNNETELLPCICGGKASLKALEYGDDCKVWGVFCESDLASEYSHGHFIDNYATEAEAIAAWNARTTHGTLTAEQVEKAIHDCSTYASYDGCTYYASGIRLQAIADELNARAERTCKNEAKSWGEFECSECGFYADFGSDLHRVRVCPDCGKAVK